VLLQQSGQMLAHDGASRPAENISDEKNPQARSPEKPSLAMLPLQRPMRELLSSLGSRQRRSTTPQSELEPMQDTALER
jgi:hypothetical protein